MKKAIATITILILSLGLFAQGARNAYQFDGDDDAVIIGAVDYGFDDEITVMGWMKWNVDPHSGDNWANVITNNRSSRTDQGQFWIQHDRNNNKLEFALELDYGRQFLWSDTKMKKDEWVHFAGTYNGYVMRLYINGVEEAHKYRFGDVRSYKSDFVTTIGKWAASGGDRYFEGEVDEISIWDRALSKDEIRTSMTSKLEGHENNLLAYYRFDEKESNIVKDVTGNYDGVVEGSKLVVSTAPVGDESVFSYGGDELSLVSHGEKVVLSEFSENPDGIHLYKVNHQPNTIETDSPDIDEIVSGSYWGVFVVGNEDVSFKYTKKVLQNSEIAFSDSLTIAYRDNATSRWQWQNITQELSDSVVFFYSEGGFAHREYIWAKAKPSLLPVELVDFNADVVDDEVRIVWETASELNNEYFTVQRSVDGFDWENIGDVIGAGNSYTVNHYEWYDENPQGGLVYYRLRQTDFDGRFEVFDPVAIQIETQKIKMQVYPNPVTDYLWIESDNANFNVCVLNASGHKLLNLKSDSMRKVSIDFQELSAGIYVIIITDDYGCKTTQKILKK